MSASSEWHLQMQQELANKISQVEQGEETYLNALIDFRERKPYLEQGLETIKNFENDNANRIMVEANQYPEGYRGYKISEVSGRKTFKFDGIDEITNASEQVNTLQKKYQSAYEGVIKGVVQVVEEDGVKYWVDADGQINPLPEMTIGKGYIKLEHKK